MPLWTWAASGWSVLWPESCKAIMKRLFSALAVVLASLLVVGGDAVLSGGASAHAVSAPQAIPVTLGRSACYPQGNFYPLSDGISTHIPPDH